ncbi:MAG: DinB family protein [Thermomicrobiales bacterium]
MSEILADLFRHNLWANLSLIDFCAELPDEVLATNVPGTFGNIRDTLAHLVDAEDFYATALTGGLPERHSVLAESSPAIAALRDPARQSGEALIALAQTLHGDPVVTIFRRGEDQRYRSSFLLVQAIDHAVEHRTQVKTALTQAGYEPPETDGWTWDTTRPTL